MCRTIAALLLFLLFPAGDRALAQGARGQSGAAQGPPRELTVSNRSQQQVRELYASPSSIDDWGDDRLGAEMIMPGKAFRLRLGRTRECTWDLKVVYADGALEENRGVNVCRSQFVAFDGSNAVAPDRTPARSLALQNASSERVDQFFVSPADSDSWLEDRLPGALEPGGDATIEFRGPCLVDVRVVYANRGAEERRGLDACQLERLVLAPGWVVSADPSSAPTPPSAAPSPARAAPDDAAVPAGRVAVRNDAGRTVVELYVHPDGGEQGDDRLGMSVLDPGQERRIPVASDKGCLQTIRAVLAGSGPELRRTGVDLCKERSLALTADGVEPVRPEAVGAAPAR